MLALSPPPNPLAAGGPGRAGGAGPFKRCRRRGRAAQGAVAPPPPRAESQRSPSHGPCCTAIHCTDPWILLHRDPLHRARLPLNGPPDLTAADSTARTLGPCCPAPIAARLRTLSHRAPLHGAPLPHCTAPLLPIARTTGLHRTDRRCGGHGIREPALGGSAAAAAAAAGGVPGGRWVLGGRRPAGALRRAVRQRRGSLLQRRLRGRGAVPGAGAAQPTGAAGRAVAVPAALPRAGAVGSAGTGRWWRPSLLRLGAATRQLPAKLRGTALGSRVPPPRRRGGARRLPAQGALQLPAARIHPGRHQPHPRAGLSPAPSLLPPTIGYPLVHPKQTRYGAPAPLTGGYVCGYGLFPTRSILDDSLDSVQPWLIYAFPVFGLREGCFCLFFSVM